MALRFTAFLARSRCPGRRCVYSSVTRVCEWPKMPVSAARARSPVAAADRVDVPTSEAFSSVMSWNDTSAGRRTKRERRAFLRRLHAFLARNGQHGASRRLRLQRSSLAVFHFRFGLSWDRPDIAPRSRGRRLRGFSPPEPLCSRPTLFCRLRKGHGVASLRGASLSCELCPEVSSCLFCRRAPFSPRYR